MFILVRKLSAVLHFAFHEMDKLSNEQEVLKRLKLKV